jgi:hypothetical protein
MPTTRLQQPLDPQAVKAANQQFWKDHPELAGQQLGADADVTLRKEWVRDYVAAGGPVEKEPDAAPDAVVATCATPALDCAHAWQDCDAKADEILNKDSDPVKRNKYINAAYAKMYLQDPKLEWLGAAAFASKQVGCGIKDAQFYKDVAEADRNPWNLDGPNPVSQAQGAYAAPVYDALANGNKAVFKDIYPAHLFYEKYGLDQMKQCAGARQPPVDKKVMDGFADIDAGHSDTGAMKILQHEQQDILQAHNVFGNQEISDIMKTNQWASQHWYGRMFGAQATSVSFTPECTGGTTVTFQGTNPADPSERWPYAQQVVNQFDQIKNDPGTIDSLQKIVQADQ